jgi:hypothetical protein
MISLACPRFNYCNRIIQSCLLALYCGGEVDSWVANEWVVAGSEPRRFSSVVISLVWWQILTPSLAYGEGCLRTNQYFPASYISWDMHLINVHLIGVYLMGMYLMSMHLTGVHQACLSH